jgi:hypothetical protein
LIQRKASLRPRTTLGLTGIAPAAGLLMAHLLLVVPDSDLGKSLDFALRADGHAISSRSSLSGDPIPVQFDCTILDHEAVGSNLRQGQTFCRAFWPVILLANSIEHELSSAAYRTIQKPMLGPVLSAALGDALAARQATT